MLYSTLELGSSRPHDSLSRRTVVSPARPHPHPSAGLRGNLLLTTCEAWGRRCRCQDLVSRWQITRMEWGDALRMLMMLVARGSLPCGFKLRRAGYACFICLGQSRGYETAQMTREDSRMKVLLYSSTNTCDVFADACTSSSSNNSVAQHHGVPLIHKREHVGPRRIEKRRTGDAS